MVVWVIRKFSKQLRSCLSLLNFSVYSEILYSTDFRVVTHAYSKSILRISKNWKSCNKYASHPLNILKMGNSPVPIHASVHALKRIKINGICISVKKRTAKVEVQYGFFTIALNLSMPCHAIELFEKNPSINHYVVLKHIMRLDGWWEEKKF